ncbi:hypothetical protein [Parenemella sanctibonifatiensis]|nr:hypothetical protein [Parenemella sanctibonifatiensis]
MSNDAEPTAATTPLKKGAEDVREARPQPPAGPWWPGLRATTPR